MPSPRSTTNGLILRYPEVSAYTEADVLVVETSDEPAVRADIEAGKMTKPFKCFSVSTDNLSNHEISLNYYFKYAYAPKWRPAIAKHSADLIFFELWERLIDDVNAGVPASILRGIERVRQRGHDFFPRLDIVLNVLEIFSTNLLAPMLAITPFCGRSPANKPRRWTTQSINWLQSLRSCIQKLQSARQSLMVPSLPTIESLLAFTRTSIAAWEQFERESSQDRCFQLSSYLFGVAEIFAKRKEFATCLLLSHRSLDLYFQYCAFDANLLSETYDSFQYTGQDPARMPVNLLNSFKLLDASPRFPAGLSNFLKPQVESLNNARNLLLLTHGVYGIEEQEAKAHLQNVKKMIDTVEGTTKWSQIRNVWTPLPKIDQSFLFEVEGSMNTYFTEVL